MQDSLRVILKSISDPWYLKYLLPILGSLIIGIVSFALSQKYFRYLDKKRAREKYLGYLRVIREEIKRNLDLLCQLHAYLYVNAYPTFKLSFFVGDEIFSGISTICLNYELLNEIFYRYFDYRHIQDRLNRILNISNELKEIKSQEHVNHMREHLVERTLENERGGTRGLIEGNTKVSFNTYNQITDEINLWNKKEDLNQLPSDYLKTKYDEFQKDPDVLNASAILKNLNPLFDLNKRPKFYQANPGEPSQGGHTQWPSGSKG